MNNLVVDVDRTNLLMQTTTMMMMMMIITTTFNSYDHYDYDDVSDMIIIIYVYQWWLMQLRCICYNDMIVKLKCFNWWLTLLLMLIGLICWCKWRHDNDNWCIPTRTDLFIGHQRLSLSPRSWITSESLSVLRCICYDDMIVKLKCFNWWLTLLLMLIGLICWCKLRHDNDNWCIPTRTDLFIGHQRLSLSPRSWITSEVLVSYDVYVTMIW
jgi:hypothetical protein